MIVAGYNMQRTPLVVSYKNDSDATVDTKYASVGATVAHIDETLGSGYRQACDCGHSHISQDGRIDASTCALPENTWFIKNMLHSKIHGGMMELYNWFFYSDEYCNVFSSPLYPQFLQNDKANNALIPMKSVSSLPEVSKPRSEKHEDIITTEKKILKQDSSEEYISENQAENPQQDSSEEYISENQAENPQTGAYFGSAFFYITVACATALICGAAVLAGRRKKNNVYPD
jgi:hypothetical protein